MNDLAVSIALVLAFVAGGLVVYIFFAARPTPYDEPVVRYAGGVRVHQVAGSSGVRPRVAVALALLVACLAFLAGFLYP